MTRRILEALFRHKLLVLLPALLIPAIVTPLAFLLTPPYYEASIGIWVDRPAYLDYKDGSNPYLSPSVNHVNRLGELLRTRAFRDDIAQRTSLAPLVGVPAGEIRLADLLAKNVTISGAGDHVLVIQFQGATAQVAFEVPQAIVDAYQEKTVADQADQAGVAVDFYQTRVQDTQKALTSASQQLRRYAAAHQDSVSNPSLGGDPSQAGLAQAILDPKLATLQALVQSAQKDASDAQSVLSSAQLSVAAAVDGQQMGFQVVDAAQMPTAPTRPIKKIVVYPIAALLAGLAISAVLLVSLVASDRSVRSEGDFAPGVRLLGVVPILKVKRVPKQLRSVATRRAIGAAAGTALAALNAAK